MRGLRGAIGVGDPAGPERFFAPGTFVSKPSREPYRDYLSASYLQVAMVAPLQAYGGPLLDVHGDVIGILAPRGFSPASKGLAVKAGIELTPPIFGKRTASVTMPLSGRPPTESM